jgi:hypothetical protein
MNKHLIRKKGANIQSECTEMTSKTVAQINKNRLTACKGKKGRKKIKGSMMRHEYKGYFCTQHILQPVCVYTV